MDQQTAPAYVDVALQSEKKHDLTVSAPLYCKNAAPYREAEEFVQEQLLSMQEPALSQLASEMLFPQTLMDPPNSAVQERNVHDLMNRHVDALAILTPPPPSDVAEQLVKEESKSLAIENEEK